MLPIRVAFGKSMQMLAPPDVPRPEAYYFDRIDLSMCPNVEETRAEVALIRYVAL